MTTRIRILGSEPAWPCASRACSGYLLETSSGMALVDCGTGVFERLRGVVPPEKLSAVIISHLHFDHWADIIPFRYYLTYEAKPETAPRLYLPPGAIEKLQGVTEAFDRDESFLTGTFRTSEYDPGGEMELLGLRVSFKQTCHPIATYAMRLQSEAGTIVYSADTGWDTSLADFASGADLFLCEAGWGARESAGPMHLTASEAGRLAEAAHVRQLVLTHLSEPMSAESVGRARQEYSGPVHYAEPGKEFAV